MQYNRRRPIVAFCLLIAAHCGVFAADAPPASQPTVAFTQQFGDDWLGRYWQFNPDDAVAVGYYQAAGDLVIPDTAFRQQYLAFIEQELEKLQAFQQAGGLAANAEINLRLLITKLQIGQFNLRELRNWQWDPSVYNVAEPISLLLNTPYAPLDSRLRAVGQRLRRVPAYYAAAIASVQQPTQEHTQLAIQQNHGALSVLGAAVDAQLAQSRLSVSEQAQFKTDLASARQAVQNYI